VDEPILIAPRWDLEFHVHTHASNLVFGTMLALNPIGKCDQEIVCTSQLLNNAEKNYTTTEREAVVMLYALHKYCHYLLSNKFLFYVAHMALLYLVKKPQFSSRITWWLLLFLEYNFLVVYKPRKSHSITDALSHLSTVDELSGVPNQVVDAPLFLLQLT
jgi:hypothetical protein